MLAVLLAAALYLPPNPTVSPLWNDWAGGFWNVGKGNEQADTNALAHVWGGAACTLTGYVLGDKLWKDPKKGTLYAAIGCSVLFTLRLFVFHAPQPTDLTGCDRLLVPIGCRPNYALPGYGAELRAGFITSIGSVWLTAIPILIF